MSASRSAVELLIRDAGAGDACMWQSLGRGLGGSAWRVTCGSSAWFVKTQTGALDLFNAEADGLKALMDCGAIRVPQVLGMGEHNAESFLVLEWLDLGLKNPVAAARLGKALAHQHQCQGAGFGWRHNNFLGATPQFNAYSDDWVKFLHDHRLGFQLRLASENGYRGVLQEQGVKLMARLPALFAGYTPRPSLLHGDLWSGNWGVLGSAEPVIFDPAVHYGDREADLAMTELFGGFPQEFYSAYNAMWPLDYGYRVRRDIYKLYHVLNHLNLFGDAYLKQVRGVMGTLLSACM